MNYVMKKISVLDAVSKKEFLRPAHRLIQTRVMQQRNYHEHPVHSDFSAEYEAIAAWATVTCSYSGIEQAMKCLLKMQGTYVEKSQSKGGHKHHDIGKIFQDLASGEQEVLRVSYSIYRSLHDYIPSDTVDCFLDAIDSGYLTWRYFLLEGNDQSNWPPTTHPGAMLEIWSSLTDILQARVFTNHGLYTVKNRIDWRLHELRCNAIHEVHDSSSGQVFASDYSDLRFDDNRVDINRYVAFFLDEASKNPLHTHAESLSLPEWLPAEEVLRRFVGKVKEDETDCDFSYFLGRAQKGEIAWNTSDNRFEKP